MQFGDAYARVGKYDNEDTRESGAEWRKKRASLVQLAPRQKRSGENKRFLRGCELLVEYELDA